MRFISRSFAGLWLGLWFIAGTAMSVGGILVLTMQFYGKLAGGFWHPVTLGVVYRLLEIAIPIGPSIEIQRAIDWMLLLPASGVLMLCGLYIGLMAGIAKRNLEMRVSHPPLVVAIEPRGALSNFGITSLHIHDR
jgi:hypothetical protein